nr:C846 [uncultured bacterium]
MANGLQTGTNNNRKYFRVRACTVTGIVVRFAAFVIFGVSACFPKGNWPALPNVADSGTR